MPERECDCPPWVLRCVHFDEQLLVLTDSHMCSTHLPLLHRCRHDVVLGGRMETAPSGSIDHCDGVFFPATDLTRFADDLPSAIAEFEKRELQLLGREA